MGLRQSAGCRLYWLRGRGLLAQFARDIAQAPVLSRRLRLCQCSAIPDGEEEKERTDFQRSPHGALTTRCCKKRLKHMFAWQLGETVLKAVAMRGRFCEGSLALLPAGKARDPSTRVSRAGESAREPSLAQDDNSMIYSRV